MLRIQVIDSHTGGEPTRVVLEGGIPLEGSTMEERREDFRRRFDHLRSGIVQEPRGSDVLVGALLTPPVDEGSAAGVVFFNNVGFIGMCGHGTIGVIETLKHLGRAEPGFISLDTPAGTVTAQLHDNGEVSIRNVKSYRFHSSLELLVRSGVGKVLGDVAYGGNWFFIVRKPHFQIRPDRVKHLTEVCGWIRDTYEREGLRGENGAVIDHVELEGVSKIGDSRNFVLCPGAAYDRSPCGTGTSAKMACLYADGVLEAGKTYLQESVTGSVFRGSVEPIEGGVIPTIVGRAFVTGESTLLFEERDPIRWGLT